jgi:uncharacterized membrane protein YgcG
MIAYIRRQFMSFWSIFKDDNEINEKSVVGFISFAIMVIYAIISIVGSLMGYDVPINETIYNSFVTVTLGSFGIATAGQAMTNWTSRRRGGHDGGFKGGFGGGGFSGGAGGTYKKDTITNESYEEEPEESEYEQRMKERQ